MNMKREKGCSHMETAGIPEKHLNAIGEEAGMWHESAEEVCEELRWGRTKAALLRWVRKHMERDLTPRERRCIELYYFHRLTYREVAKELGIGAASAQRASIRGVQRLRFIAQEESGSWRRLVPRRGGRTVRRVIGAARFKTGNTEKD